MLVLTRERGAVRWDDLHVGEQVWAQDEFDPQAPATWKRVEEIFRTEALLWKLQAAGQEIETTAEHPFWVEGRGWTAVKDLAVGELLRGHDGQLWPVEAVTPTTDLAAVYNCRIAEYHTYFVQAPGGGAWLWAHNWDCGHHARILRKNMIAQKQPAKYAAHLVPSGDWSRRKVGNKVRQMQKWLNDAGIGTDHAANGFFTNCRKHMGTHRDKFIEFAHQELQSAAQGGRAALLKALGDIRAEVLTGRFLKP